MKNKSENKAVLTSASAGTAQPGVVPAERMPAVVTEPRRTLTIAKPDKKPKK